MATRPRARSSRSHGSKTSDSDRPPPPSQAQPAQRKTFDPCASTASHFLYAQRNVIVVLHQDSLAVERKFEGHKHPVQLIVADNVSEIGGGRQIASYDTGQNAIVWDLFTGGIIARFSSYEDIHTAAWMRDGSVAFGNTQGNIILFEPSSEEHTSTRTIFDPITALAPSSDCRTFAIGYKNGSILVATLHPSFTILHTLTTARAPAPITGLAWHGSSSKQKTDMLATQNADGDLRVWSVSKAPHMEQARVIRVLGSPEVSQSSLNWFAWSKNGRIVSHSDGETKAWDVRTKKMTSEIVPTIDNVIAIANYGPHACLFTVGQNHTVQQYDLTAEDGPAMVANVQHVPPNAPPTPPDSIDELKLPRTVPMKLMSSEPPPGNASVTYETSEDEGPVLSPLEKIAKEMDDLEEERRDQLAPLSPISSRASMSSASSYGRQRRRRASPQREQSPRSSEGTLFSGESSMHSLHDSVSIHSITTDARSSVMDTALRKSTMRGPNESDQMRTMDLFPYAKARLSEVKFRPPQYPNENLTPDILRREMLSIVFGWDYDTETLIRDEQSRHKEGSAPVVLLSKWLGDDGADAMASMVASESMSSSDWILLALTANMGSGAQNKVGEALVRRSLEANEIHPAVAILLGLGSLNEAIEVYVSRKYYLEAVLLTCLLFPHDWGRQSHLVREWGTAEVRQRNADFAVRCFSCTSIETSEPWFSPKSQDMVYQAQQKALAPDPASPPASPPSAGSSNRLTTKNASLKLITTFGDKGLPKPQETTMGFTPIADTAVTPGPDWKRSNSRGLRDASETRTATPGGSRNRFPSSTRRHEGDATLTAIDGHKTSRKATPALSDADGPTTAIDIGHPADTIPSPAPPVFKSNEARDRASSKDRNYHNLHITMVPTVESEEAASPQTGTSNTSRGRHKRSTSGVSRNSKTSALETPATEADPISPAMTTGSSVKSFKGRSIDRYISSLEEANSYAQQQHSEYRMRAGSRDGRSRSRPGQRDTSQPRQGSDATYIKPGKRSPSSPKSMTAEDASKYTATLDSYADKPTVRPATTEPTITRRARSSSRQAVPTTREESPDSKPASRSRTRAASTNTTRMSNRNTGTESTDAPSGEMTSFRSGRHSPPSPAPMESEPVTRSRQRSSSRRGADARARSTGRLPREKNPEDLSAPQSPDAPLEGSQGNIPQVLSRKALAAKELEDRRLSLARRTPIPQPGEYSGKPIISPQTIPEGELLSSRSFQPSGGYFGIPRSQTVDPGALQRQNGNRAPGTSTTSVPIGLPATPRAMRHPRYMGSEPDEKDTIPAVPALPENLQTLVPLSYQPGAKEADDIGPLLPSTVYGGQRPPLARSASAPPEKYMGDNRVPKSSPRRDLNASKTHSRQGSERNPELRRTAATIGQNHAVDEEEVIIIGEESSDRPPILAELAHLAGPPPPPPPPTMYQNTVPPPPPSGVINIAIDGGNEANSSVHQGEDASMMPQPLVTGISRERQNSLETSSTKGSSKWRHVTDKMRNGSRSRNSNKSPTSESQFFQQQAHYQSLSSDSILVPSAYHPGNGSPPAAPYETNVNMMPPPPPPPIPSFAATSLAAENSSPISGSTQGYRNPKDIRANMQQGSVDLKPPSPPQMSEQAAGHVSEAAFRGSFF